MPKLSVYVADDLWASAKKASSGKANNSQVVQQALANMVKEQQLQRSAFDAGAVRDDARVARLVQGLRDEFRAEYSAGYAAGLDLVEAMSYFDLQLVINEGGMTDEDACMYIAYSDPDDAVGKWWDANGGKFAVEKNAASQSEPFCAGVAQAVEDVWQSLRANAWGTADPTDQTPPNEQVDGAEDN